MSDPAPPVNYVFTTTFTQGPPNSRGTLNASGFFDPVPPRNPDTDKRTIKVNDTVTFKFSGTATDPQNTPVVSASAFIAICKGELKGQVAPVGSTKVTSPVNGVTMTMTDDSIGFWGFTISFAVDFTDPQGNVVSSEFFYLPDPEVDVETGTGG